MAASKIILFVLICVSELTHHVNAQGLNSSMQNTAALIGDTSTSLTCGAETALPSYVTWSECITTPGCVSIGYDDTLLPAYTGQYRLAVTGNTGEFKLEIQSLAATEVGQYKCHATALSTSQSYAEIIALAAAPSCTWNTTDDGNQAVEGDFLHMNCQVSYTGRRAPVTRWNEGLTAIKETVTELAKYSVIVEVGRVRRTYVATTTFDKPTDTGAGEADNAPDYQHTHAYHILSVDFGPHSLAINPDKPSYYPGEIITCSASGNPAPTFKWIKVGTNGTSQDGSGLDLEITVDMLGSNNYSCEASNTDFRGGKHSHELEKVFTVQRAGSGMSVGEMAGIIVLIVVFIVSAVVVTLVVLQIRVISSSKNKNQ